VGPASPGGARRGPRHWLRRRLPILAALGVLLSCGGPRFPNPRQPGPDRREAQHAGVSFTYSTDDFAGVTLAEEPKLTLQDVGDGIPVDVGPAHSCFRLEDKRPLPALAEGPRYFFPAESFVCAIPLHDPSVEDFGAAYPFLVSAVATLTKMLRERPSTPEGRRYLPDQPTIEAGHSVVSRFGYLDFRSGAGILYLTQYSQEMTPNPVNNEELTLVFQGLTRDGRYYLAARLAITHPSLPRGIDFTDDIERDTAFRYLRKGEEDLEGFAEGSFQPSLTHLKALLASIHVER